MIKRIVKIVLYIAFVIAAVIYTPKILSNMLHTPYPMATITSGSMWPALKTNDLIFMKGVNPDEVEVGQIVIYQNNKGFTIHRLIRKTDNGKYVTKGDANNVEDAPIDRNKIVGRAVYVGKNPFRIPLLGAVARSLGPKINQVKQ